MSLPGTASIDTYGGPLEDFRPVDDPKTQRPATAANEQASDTAMMTRTAPRAYVKFTGHASQPVLVSHWAQWGDDPALAPVLSLAPTGIVTVQWPTTVTDDLEQSKTFICRAGHGQVQGAGRAWVEPHDTIVNAAKVHLLDAAGAANNLVGFAVEAWVY